MSLDSISLILLEGSFQGAVAGLVLAGAAWLVRRRSPDLAHGLVAIGLLKFALPPALPFPTGVFTMLPVRFQAVSVEDGVSTWSILGIIYLAGVVVVLAKRGLEVVELQRLVTRSTAAALTDSRMMARLSSSMPLPRKPTLRLSADIDVPCTFGSLRPVILLPRELVRRLTDDEMRAVLLHELGHVRRRDTLWNVLSSLLGIVWWFHPVYHLLDRFGRALREERCDEDVVSNGEVEAAEYASAILTVAAFRSSRRLPFAAAADGAGHPLARRVRNIARMTRTPRARHRIPGLALLLISAFLVLPGVSLSSSVSEAERTIFVHAGQNRHSYR